MCGLIFRVYEIASSLMGKKDAFSLCFTLFFVNLLSDSYNLLRVFFL